MKARPAFYLMGYGFIDKLARPNSLGVSRIKFVDTNWIYLQSSLIHQAPGPYPLSQLNDPLKWEQK
jgi:hypothetical protein